MEQAVQELGSDLMGQAFVTATITVWDADPSVAEERQRLVDKTSQGRAFTCMRETVHAIRSWAEPSWRRGRFLGWGYAALGICGGRRRSLWMRLA